MSTIDYMKDIVSRFRKILDAHDTHMKLFDKYAVQVEGWLKGELLSFFDGEKTDGRLHNFWPESPTGPSRKRVDYLLQLFERTSATKVWIELKHFQIGYQREERWKASSYFASRSYGIYGDVAKLSEIVEGDKYILILATKNPEHDEHGDWSKGVHKFNEKFRPLHVKSCTDPSDFPQAYFLGLLEITTP